MDQISWWKNAEYLPLNGVNHKWEGLNYRNDEWKDEKKDFQLARNNGYTEEKMGWKYNTIDRVNREVAQ